MPQLLWDSSALIKRYLSEIGSPTVNSLFNLLVRSSMASTFLCYAEAAATIRRKLDQATISLADFDDARASLRAEVLDDPAFILLSVDDAAFLSGVTLTDHHNLNSSDAALLATYLRHSRLRAAGSPPCVLIASDQRLLRAAQLEGLATINPELLAPGDVPATLAAL